MLIKIEEKLLLTFNTKTPEPATLVNIKNGIEHFGSALRTENEPSTEDDDMSLLEEIVNFTAPDFSHLINEQEHDENFSNLLSDSEHQDTSQSIKLEPRDRPVVEYDESSNSQDPQTASKPYKCDVRGCGSSSTTITALKKHKRRVHNIRVKEESKKSQKPSPKLSVSNPLLYNRLAKAAGVGDFKCKFCNMLLRNKRVLLRHIETVHMRAKFYCTVPGCNHSSTRKDNYRLHLRNYHRNLPEDEMKRVLDETRNMKPVYSNNFINLIADEDLKGELESELLC
jgi:hypothetical protein